MVLFTKSFLIDDFDEISWNIKKEIGIARYNFRQKTAFDFACNLLLFGCTTSQCTIIGFFTSVIVKESHYTQVARWAIFMEQKLRFGLVLGRLAILKKKLGRLWATFEGVSSCFYGQNFFSRFLVASALKSCIKCRLKKI